jgi:AMMECR1 domain-containing protein
MLSLEEGKKAVVFARNTIEKFVKNSKITIDDLDGVFTYRLCL